MGALRVANSDRESTRLDSNNATPKSRRWVTKYQYFNIQLLYQANDAVLSTVQNAVAIRPSEKIHFRTPKKPQPSDPYNSCFLASPCCKVRGSDKALFREMKYLETRYYEYAPSLRSVACRQKTTLKSFLLYRSGIGYMVKK